jgi:anti-sigma factor RsiW
MACEQWRSQLDSYLDGELPSAAAGDLIAHLRGCPGCTAEVLARVRIKRSVQLAGKRYAPGVEFRNKITKTFAKKPRLGNLRRWSLALIPALVIVITAFFLNAYVGRERTARQRVYSELADLHVATLASATPVDVLSTDRHTVKPWFQGKIPFTFNLPELAGSPFSLIGGRVFYLEQVSGAHLIYQVRKHEISVFILPDRVGALESLPSGAANSFSFQTETWTQKGLRYFVVGDASADDIRALAKLLRDAG